MSEINDLVLSDLVKADLAFMDRSMEQSISYVAEGLKDSVENAPAYVTSDSWRKMVGRDLHGREAEEISRWDFGSLGLPGLSFALVILALILSLSVSLNIGSVIVIGGLFVIGIVASIIEVDSIRWKRRRIAAYEAGEFYEYETSLQFMNIASGRIAFGERAFYVSRYQKHDSKVSVFDYDIVGRVERSLNVPLFTSVAIFNHEGGLIAFLHSPAATGDPDKPDPDGLIEEFRKRCQKMTAGPQNPLPQAA